MHPDSTLLDRPVLPDASRDLLRSRRTIHLFDPTREVPREALWRALEVASFAPNHKLTEPWRVYLLGPHTARELACLNAEVVREKSGEAVAEAKRQRWLETPGFLVITCRRSADGLREREDYAACACALHNLSLSLWSEGIGTKWTTGPVTRDPRFFDLVGMDAAAEAVVGLVMYGYPAEVPETRRRPPECFTVELP